MRLRCSESLLRRKWMRVAFSVALWVLAFVTAWPSDASAQINPRDLIEGQADRVDDGELQRFLDQVYRDAAGYAPEIRWRDLVREYASGRVGLDLNAVFKGLVSYLFGEVVANSRLLGKLVVLAVAAALLQNISSAFEGRGVSDLAQTACCLALIVIATGSFIFCIGVARNVIQNLVTLMKALLPMLIALLAGSGAPVSAGLLHPLMISVVYGVSIITSDYVFPLIALAAVIDILGYAVRPFKMAGVAQLLRQAGTAVLGLSMAAFLGVMIVNRAAGGVADGIALRTAKFLSNTFVPVVGKMFSDAVEMVFASSHVLKGAIGLVGALAVFVTVAFPLLKVVALVIIYRVAAALVQPVGADVLADCLSSIANSLTVIAVAAGSVAMMFIFAIAALASAAHPV